MPGGNRSVCWNYHPACFHCSGDLRSYRWFSIYILQRFEDGGFIVYVSPCLGVPFSFRANKRRALHRNEIYPAIQRFCNEISVVVSCCILLASSWALYYFKKVSYYLLPFFTILCLITLSLLIIVYSHTAVYFIVRCHGKQIRTEQISGEEVPKFLDEAKAWKTTSIIIGFVFLSYLPGLLLTLAVFSGVDRSSVHILRPALYSCLMLTSLCNPIIYSASETNCCAKQ